MINWDIAKTLRSIKSICGIWTVLLNSTTDCGDKKWQNSTRSRLFYTPPLTGNETQHWFPTALAGLSVSKGRCVSVSVFMWAYSSPHVVLTNQAWTKSESVSEHSVTLTHKQQPSHPPTHCVDLHRPLNPLSEIEDSGTNMAPAKKRNKVWISSSGIHQSIDFFVLRMRKIPQNMFWWKGWKTE